LSQLRCAPSSSRRRRSRPGDRPRPGRPAADGRAVRRPGCPAPGPRKGLGADLPTWSTRISAPDTRWASGGERRRRAARGPGWPTGLRTARDGAQHVVGCTDPVVNRVFMTECPLGFHGNKNQDGTGSYVDMR
jgi:hypothetical protein